MGIPAFGAAGSPLTYASRSGSAPIPVPSGVAADDIIILQLYMEGTMAVMPPTDFTAIPGSPIIVASGSSIHRQHVMWKRATGADSGTYSPTWSGSSFSIGVATRFTGCVTSGSPLDGTPSTASRTTNGTTTPAVSLTTTGPDRLLVFGATGYGPYTFTPPTNFTERVDTAEALTLATRDWATAAASGNVSATQSTGTGQTAWLLALIGASAVGPPRPRTFDRYRPLVVR